ncbi:MAG: SpoIIE family protein phosphatase [Acidobacteriota bacterium]
MPLKRLIQQALAVLRTLPGRLFLLSAGLLIVIGALQWVAGLPPIVDLFRKVVVIAFIGSATWLFLRALRQTQRQWLWAVRRKLILSYVFFGVIPVALIVLFVSVASLSLYMNFATYLFQAGYQSVVADAAAIAKTAADDIGQSPSSAATVIARQYASRKGRNAAISFAAVHRSPGGTFETVTAGPWRHLPAPRSIPDWLLNTPGGFRGTLALTAGGASDDRLLIRAVMASADGQDFVIVDLPVNADVLAQLHDNTGARIDGVTFNGDAPVVTDAQRPAVAPFRYAVSWMDYTDWQTGKPARASISVEAPVAQLYDRMVVASGSGQFLNASALRQLLIALAVLFFVIQVSAFIGGVALARRITSAVHYLFYGTARIGQGDFTHRIPIGSNDQLGDLAGSFNNMSASIEHLRHIERDKLRLDEELQIARRIQRSLLPSSVPQIPGLCIADLCEPAMEVGGDYYDVFLLGPRQVGVLVADVSGKGTSAALYMAELKGLMLALSRSHRSPRALLVELNDLLADHLDNRSFITMTYAVIDLDAGTLTCARAGHTPLLVVRGGDSHVIIPDGMVLGLRLPGAGKRFSDLLEEYTQPVQAGDVIVLYTDGITEAMTADGDLFGDEALARVVVAHRALDSAGIRERILRDVRAFVGDAEPHDDMTMVVLKIKDVA